MRRAALGLSACIFGVCLASIASAADMGARKAAPPPPPVFSWTGVYIGGHLGGAWGTVEKDLVELREGGVDLLEGLVVPIASYDINGFLGGVQGGFNWQLGFVVFGAEVQASWGDIEGRTPCAIVFACHTENRFLVTFAGRLGVAVDRALLYLKGGVAWAETEYGAFLELNEIIGFDTHSVDHFGVVGGAGIEYAFLPNWSAKIEYNFVDFESERVRFRPILDPTLEAVAEVRQHLHVVKIGVNYRFGFAGPVVAKY